MKINKNLYQTITIVIIILLTIISMSYLFIKIIDNKLSKFTVTTYNNKKVSLSDKKISDIIENKDTYNVKVQPLNFENRPIINANSKHEISQIQPIEYFDSNSIGSCSKK